MGRAFSAGSLLALMSSGALGQLAVAPPAFDVASIKPNQSGNRRGGVHADPGKVVGTNATLQQLILFAYDLPGYQLSGPSWIETERYDLGAKAEGSPLPGTGQLRVMLQTLLADRFGFKAHREVKTLSVYTLVVAEDGPRLPDEKTGDALLQKGLCCQNSERCSCSSAQSCAAWRKAIRN